MRNLLTGIKNFYNFALADRTAEARSWAKRAGRQTYEKRLLDARSWPSEIW